jgi:phage recombination protein Bet
MEMNNIRTQERSLSKQDKPAQAVAAHTPTPQPRASLVRTFATKLGVEPEKLMTTLKDTAFKQPSKDGKPGIEVTDAQMMALLVVANEYGLNPFLREIYAFPTKGGGIAPIVSIDGWIRIVNSRPEFKSMEFAYPPDGTDKADYYVECTIERRDREKPIIVREYFAEVYRNTDPWNSHPRRMTRHKAFIQCARLAFGFGGIYDPDEAERIANAMAIDVTPTSAHTKPATRAPQARQIEQQPSNPPPADAVADEDGEFRSLASEPQDEDEAGVRG